MPPFFWSRKIIDVRKKTKFDGEKKKDLSSEEGAIFAEKRFELGKSRLSLYVVSFFLWNSHFRFNATHGVTDHTL